MLQPDLPADGEKATLQPGLIARPEQAELASRGEEIVGLTAVAPEVRGPSALRSPSPLGRTGPDVLGLLRSGELVQSGGSIRPYTGSVHAI